MENTIKLGIIWIIVLLYLPIGFWLIQEVNTLISITIAFITLVSLMIYGIYITFKSN